MLIANNGDISFYEDTGTTPKFVWDASAEALNVGGSTNYAYDINTGDGGYGINSTGVAQLVMRGTEFRLHGVSAAPMSFYTDNAERLRIDASGNVGISTSSPSDLLDISANGTSAMRLSDSSSPATYAQRSHAHRCLGQRQNRNSY
jgi:hypothetical protein